MFYEIRLFCLALLWTCVFPICHGWRLRRSISSQRSALSSVHKSFEGLGNSSGMHVLARGKKSLGQSSATSACNPSSVFATLLVSAAAAYNPSVARTGFFSSHLNFAGSCRRAFTKRNRLGCCNLAQIIKNGQLVKVEIAESEMESLRNESLVDASWRMWAAACAINERKPGFAIMRSESSIKFWAMDMSGGAGAISSPNLDEHPVTISGSPTLTTERFFAWLFDRAPQWLLFATMGALTREIASRSVLDSIPEWQRDEEAKKKAESLAMTMKSKFNTAVKNTLAPANFGNASNFMQRFVNDQYQVLNKDEDIWQRIAGIYDAEVTGAIQKGLGAVFQMNESSMEQDLGEILRTADVDGDDIITLDELHVKVTGKKLSPEVRVLAGQVPVLKSSATAKDRWERWRSLVIAPVVKNILQAGNFFQKVTNFLDSFSARMEQEMNERRQVLIRFFDIRIAPVTGLPRSEVLKRHLENWAAKLGHAPPGKRFHLHEQEGGSHKPEGKQ